jgi:hypothetical protein
MCGTARSALHHRFDDLSSPIIRGMHRTKPPNERAGSAS